MDKLKEYFKKDCGEMDKNRTPYDFYVMGYNRAKLEELEHKINELESKEKQLKFYHWLDGSDDLPPIGGFHE